MSTPSVTTSPSMQPVVDELPLGTIPRRTPVVGRAINTGISGIQGDLGANVWGRGIKTPVTGLTAGGGTGTVSGTTSSALDSPGLGTVKYAITSGQTLQDVQSRWAGWVQGLDKGVDVNELVQQVLRESYMQTTEDLKFYAEKVKFYNELKKGIREELKNARDQLAKYAKLKDGDPIDPPYTKQDIDTTFYGVSGPQFQAIQPTDAQALSGSGLQKWDGSHPPLDPAPASGSDVFVTNDGYAVSFKMVDGYGEVRMYNTDGKQISRLWGDPHVDTQAGSNVWSFGQSSTFVLPDGTKLSLNCTQVSDGIYKIDGMDILSGTEHASVGTSPDGTAGTGKITQDRVDWDAAHADSTGDASSGVFVVQADGHFLKSVGNGQLETVTAQDWPTYQRTHAVTTGGDTQAASGDVKSALQDGAAMQELDKTCATKGELSSYIKDLEDKLNSASDDAQLSNVDLQNMLQKQQQTLQMMSNISKMLNDTAMAIIRKIGG